MFSLTTDIALLVIAVVVIYAGSLTLRAKRVLADHNAQLRNDLAAQGDYQDPYPAPATRPKRRRRARWVFLLALIVSGGAWLMLHGTARAATLPGAATPPPAASSAGGEAIALLILIALAAGALWVGRILSKSR